MNFMVLRRLGSDMSQTSMTLYPAQASTDMDIDTSYTDGYSSRQLNPSGVHTGPLSSYSRSANASVMQQNGFHPSSSFSAPGYPTAPSEQSFILAFASHEQLLMAGNGAYMRLLSEYETLKCVLQVFPAPTLTNFDIERVFIRYLNGAQFYRLRLLAPLLHRLWSRTQILHWS